MTYTIITEADLAADEMPIGIFRAVITFTWADASGDGWNEPHEAAHAEFASARQVGGDWLDAKLVTEWAQEWLAQQDGDLASLLEKDRATFDDLWGLRGAMAAAQRVAA